MANVEHFEILKKGIFAWNEWRKEFPETIPDLSSVNLHSHDLRFFNLSSVDFSDANLRYSNLSSVNLEFAKFNSTDLNSTNLSYANAKNAEFDNANLSYANLAFANLENTLLRNTDFSYANLQAVNLKRANLEMPFMNGSILGSIDLKDVKNLESVRHYGPSNIDHLTFRKSKGEISNVFLQGCGLSKWEIVATKLFNPSLSPLQITDIIYQIDELKNSNPIQMQNLFISYNHKDAFFVDALEGLLRERDISFWRDIHNPSSGKLEKAIDRAMRLNQIVVIVLSENSIASDWVQFEVRKARKIEIEQGKDVMCPIALDGSWKNARWPIRLKEQIMEYNVLDFSGWQDEIILKKQFNNLIKGLNLFYKKTN